MATDRNNLEQMRSLVKAWRISGTGQKAFCATQQINIHTFKYWVEKIDRINRTKQPNQSEVKKVPPTHKSKGFIPLKAPISLAQNDLEIRFPQGAVLQLGQDLSATSVQIIKSLLY
jgi:uncharacterized protein (UPF0335 family)